MKKVSMTANITLALSVHRPEMIPFSADWMRRSDAIFLEEPPAVGFEDMLRGTIEVDEYLMPLDVEYPAFARKMCFLLRDLKSKGKSIYQVEPYLETLLSIHEFFADGHQPRDLSEKSLHYPVYLAERNATGALLHFYQTAMKNSFDKAVGAVKDFARFDAARFRLRDSLRAQALAPLVDKHQAVFIEAGVIHFPLWRLLRQMLSCPDRLKVIYLADVALNAIGRQGHLYGPGDQLTLLYIYHPQTLQSKRETLLAARSLIFSKLAVKLEVDDGLETLPHLRSELACIQLTNRLSLEDCRRLFPRLRRLNTLQAQQMVTEYLANCCDREMIPISI